MPFRLATMKTMKLNHKSFTPYAYGSMIVTNHNIESK